MAVTERIKVPLHEVKMSETLNLLYALLTNPSAPVSHPDKLLTIAVTLVDKLFDLHKKDIEAHNAYPTSKNKIFKVKSSV